MISFQCKSCGGDMSIDRTGELLCPFCGTKNFFTDKQLQEYKEFRLRMLEYLSAVAEDRKTPESKAFIWNQAATATFEDEEGTDITIQYIYHGIEDGVEMYCAHSNVIYIYPKRLAEQADRAVQTFSKLAFPQADMKGLGRCFPRLAGKYELKDLRNESCICWCSTMVVHLTCNEGVGGSSPFTSSILSRKNLMSKR